jgi:hypothetical protein
MKRLIYLGIFFVLLLGGGTVLASESTIVNYGDVTLTGGSQSGHFLDWWDLTASEVEISFTYDANGLVDDYGGSAHAWAELGVRSPCYGDFNPTWMAEGAGVWLSTDYDWAAYTFDPDPVGAPTLDLDDKLILQKAGGMGEGAYNLPSTPPNPGANHRVWWDRDGVDPWQNDETANTEGIYNIVITLEATSATSGKAYMKINDLDQGFETDGNWNTIELTPAGMTFTGDMKHLQVFYGLYGYGATHSVEFRDITIDGTFGEPPLASCYEQSIDIKPCSDPNSINRKANGVTPVAVLGSIDFDVTNIDPSLVEFAGAAPLTWTFEDVGQDCGENDSFMDLLFLFKTQELEFEGDSVEGYLIGYLKNGEFFWGMDTVKILH